MAKFAIWQTPAVSPTRGEDLSLVASVLADAHDRGLVDDEGALREQIDARGAKCGLPKGTSLYNALTGRRDA